MCAAAGAAATAGASVALDRGAIPSTDLAPLEAGLLADARDGQLDEHDLFEAALLAGGIHDAAQRRAYRAGFERACRRARRHLEAWQCEPPVEAAGVQHAALDRAGALFRFMHQELLAGGYRVDASRLSGTLDEGRYNCVTGTILFHCLAEACGLEPVAVATRGHVFSRLKGEPDCDIQTTCRNWFEQLAEPTVRFQHACGGTAGGEPREISEVNLVGKIYYNLAVAELGDHEFGRAVDRLAVSLQLDPDDPAAWENLLAAINNWSLSECEAGRFERAAELLARGTLLAPRYPPLRANDLHIHQKWVIALCGQGRHADAVQLLEQGYARRPEAELFDRGRYAVCRLWAESLFCDGRTEQAWEVLRAARQRYDANPELLAYEAQAIGAAAEQLLRRGQTDRARCVLERGLALHPQDATLRRRLHDLTGGES